MTFFCLFASASAEPLETTLAVTVNALSGDHEVAQGQRDRLRFAPLPLVELALRSGADGVRIEGLPPLTLGQFTTDGVSSTRLSILNATYRRTLAGGWFAGAGETIYNQSTTYPVRSGTLSLRGGGAFFVDGPEIQSSRVTGLRLEAGRSLSHGATMLEFAGALNPAMHGVQYTRFPDPVAARDVLTFADPETATQVDLSARAARRIARRGEVLLGMRYLNYVAHYTGFPGQLADRNVGLALTLGMRVTL